jgi:hypothetical protein
VDLGFLSTPDHPCQQQICMVLRSVMDSKSQRIRFRNLSTPFSSCVLISNVLVYTQLLYSFNFYSVITRNSVFLFGVLFVLKFLHRLTL